MDSMKTVQQQIKKAIKDQKLESMAEVTYDADGMQIEFKNKLLFRSGSAQSTAQFDQTAQTIMEMIAKIGNDHQIIVEGHTDDAVLRGSKRYPSNWELSAARGFTMMRKLHKLGVADRHLSVVAYAHTRPKVAYAGLKGKQLEAARAQNRRVIVRIE